MTKNLAQKSVVIINRRKSVFNKTPYNIAYSNHLVLTFSIINCFQLISAVKQRGERTLLHTAVAVLVAVLTVSVGYAYVELDALKAKNELLIETKGRFETYKMFIDKKLSNETQVANTGRLMDMLMHAQDSLANSRGDFVDKEKQCSKQQHNLHKKNELLLQENVKMIIEREKTLQNLKLCYEQEIVCRTELHKLDDAADLANEAKLFREQLQSCKQSWHNELTKFGEDLREWKFKQLSHLQQEFSSVRDNISELIAIVSPQYHAPMEFIISNFSEKQKANEEWYSSPFYTHNRGYKFRLQVYPNGYRGGRGSHLSVYAQLMRGEYDKELKWPFEGDIRVELLNWRADKNHLSCTIPFNRYTHPNGTHSAPVTNQETATSLGNAQFISHTDLASTTKYILDNYFQVRVSVAVYSTPLLHLTPAWQDSLSTTQSGAQFTISQYSKRKQFNNQYYSPPFTTSPQGYRFCLKVFTNGYGSRKGSHLSIFAHIVKGQHDGRLQWPFTGTIIIELLNWLEDKGHYKMTLSIGTNNKILRVTEGEFGKNTGYRQFISQSSLNSSTNPQYLYHDCIRIRVQAIATTIYKPLFLFTSYRGSLSSTTV